jgi:hypothetical protein
LLALSFSLPFELLPGGGFYHLNLLIIVALCIHVAQKPALPQSSGLGSKKNPGRRMCIPLDTPLSGVRKPPSSMFL